jgi:hypothetical protein
MTGMRAYYISRAFVSAAFGLLLVLGGSPWWAGVAVGALAFVWFLVAPRIGRYAVHPDLGITALRRDERGSAINNAAARNAFVGCMLAVGGAIAYAATNAMNAVPLAVLQWLLILGVVIYYASDFWMRRLHS